MPDGAVGDLALVGPDDAIHADDMGLDLVEELPQRQAGLEIERLIQREYPEVLVMDTMALGGHRATIDLFAEVGNAVGIGLAAFLKGADIARDVVVDPVDEPVAARTDQWGVRVVADHGETLCPLRRTGPVDWRRQIFAFAGIPLGDGLVRSKGTTSDLQR